MELARPQEDRRADYVPRTNQDRFIVTLLGEAIRAGIEQAARELGSGARALDWGCGRQPFRADLERGGFRYSGADVHQQAGPKLDYVCAADESLPNDLLAASPFDFVLCTEVLEHVADWTRAFGNLALLVRPGGLVLITCPFVYPLHEEPYDFYRVTTHAIRSHAHLAGFDVVECRTLGSGWEVLGTVLASITLGPARPGPLGWLATRAAKAARRFTFGLVKRGWAQRFVRADVGMFLSNYVVLKRR